ncbi:MAG: hypothetical protein OER96_06530 [Gammaproteobacteria bacterium]|nr:hypothetical protein [Gammaproteobacteria bacterium]
MHGRKLISFFSIALFILISLALLIWTTALSTPLTSEEGDINSAGANVEINADDAANIHAAGARVTIKGKARQNIRAAGALVNIDAESGGDLHVAGSRVSLKGNVTGEAWLAGAEVNIDAVTGKALKAAGASIDVSENAKLASNSSLAAALIEFHGASEDNFNLYGDEIVFSGQASGAVTIKGRKVSVTENARIQGDLTIQSGEKAIIDPAAMITGKVTQTSLTKSDFKEEEEGVFAGVGGALIFAASAFLLGLILVVFIRGSVDRGINMLRSRPGKSILWGLAVFFGVPILAVLAMVTIVGIPIGIATLLMLPLLLLLGFTMTALGVSDWLFNRAGETKETGQRLLLLAAGVVMFVVLGFVPVLGPLLIILAVLFGLGAAVVTIGCRLSSRTIDAPF